MILVTLGTQDKSFIRLLEAIDKQIEVGNINEKVIVQAGSTVYKSNNMEIFDLLDGDEFEDLIKKCRILITHGGVGSILGGIKNEKIVIAAPRLSKYKEHTNDHQLQIVKKFSNDGYILDLTDFNKLGQVLEQAKTFKPKRFKSNTKKLENIVNNYIEKENNTSWYNKYLNLVNAGSISLFLTVVNIFIVYFINHSINNIYISNLIGLIIVIILSFNRCNKNNKIIFITNKLFLIIIYMLFILLLNGINNMIILEISVGLISFIFSMLYSKIFIKK